MNINGRVKVKTLKAQFFEEFGLTIRVYDGRSFADDNATLASIRRGESIGGEFSPRKNTKVGNLEDKIKELFGLKTQIAGSDNSYLCDNKITLAKAKEDDDARMERKARKASRIKIKNEIENTDEEEFGLLNEDDDTNFYGECENTVKVLSVNGDKNDVEEFFDNFDEQYFSMLEHQGFYAEEDLPIESNPANINSISIQEIDTSDFNTYPDVEKFEKVICWTSNRYPSLLTVLNLSREYDNLIFTLDVDNLQRGIVAFIVISNGKILKCNKINIDANIIKLLDYNFNILSLSKGECLEDLGVGGISVYCIDENTINDNEIEKKFNIKFQCESSSIFLVSLNNNRYISHSYHDDMDNDDETNTGYFNEMILHSQSSSFYSPDINSVTKDDHSFLIRLDGLSIDDIEDYEIELIDGIHPNGIKAIDVYKNTFDNFFASLSLTTGLIINGVILSKHGDNNCLYDYYTDLENYINVIDDLSYIRIFLFVTDTKDELTLDERFLEMEDYCFNATFLNDSGLLVTQTYDRGEYDTGYYSSADEGDYVVDEEEFCNAKKFFNKN